MARPVLNVVDHGQQSWDADVNNNFDVFENQATLIPEYANFAALPAAALYDNCLAALTDTNSIWQSDGTRWLPLDGILKADSTLATTTGGAEQTLKSHQFPADYLVVGDQLVVEGWGIMNDATQNGDMLFRWGGTGGTVISPSVETFNAQEWLITCRISITGAATQQVLGVGRYSAPTPILAGVQHTSPTVALNATIDLLLRGDNVDGANNNAAQVLGWSLRIIPTR